jgi:hypothetical protein
MSAVKTLSTFAADFSLTVFKKQLQISVQVFPVPVY